MSGLGNVNWQFGTLRFFAKHFLKVGIDQEQHMRYETECKQEENVCQFVPNWYVLSLFLITLWCPCSHPSKRPERNPILAKNAEQTYEWQIEKKDKWKMNSCLFEYDTPANECCNEPGIGFGGHVVNSFVESVGKSEQDQSISISIYIVQSGGSPIRIFSVSSNRSK